jgi:hypothetical protein
MNPVDEQSKGGGHRHQTVVDPATAVAPLRNCWMKLAKRRAWRSSVRLLGWLTQRREGVACWPRRDGAIGKCNRVIRGTNDEDESSRPVAHGLAAAATESHGCDVAHAGLGSAPQFEVGVKRGATHRFQGEGRMNGLWKLRRAHEPGRGFHQHLHVAHGHGAHRK